jgi:signal transduction histidine kinase/CheY-like chemotaxis protein
MARAVGGKKTETADAVEAEQIRTLLRQSPWISAINPANAAIVGAVLWSPGRRAVIVLWVLGMLGAALLRALMARRFRTAMPRSRELGSWSRRYIVAAGAVGILWGTGSLLLYASGDHAAEMILVFVIAGMTAGAAGTLAVYLPAFYAYATPTLLPLALRILAEGGPLHVAMGALGLVYFGALALVASGTNRAIADAFRFRFQNEALLARLAGAQTSLEEANRTLEQRVIERSDALKRQDEALQEARRMESLGLLAGGVAHDFNNLLTVILGNSALLQEEPSLAATPGGPLDEIRGAGERAAALVSQLLASSRRQARKPRVLDLNAVVSETHRLLSRLIGEQVELSVALRAGPLPVFADRGQIEQVIVNLTTNARDAMPKGGRLTIETGEVTIAGGPERTGEDPAALPPGPYAVLSVRDTGVGMDIETLRLAFQPFFTTKEVGKGTGLGLATVYGIVEQSGGRVFAESELGAGSTFRVFLPRATGAVVEDPELVPQLLTPPRGATALVVEDEPEVRGVIGRVLSGAGLTVLEAGDGEQALARVRAHAGTIDLLVTDVVMARMDGPELARRLAMERPGVRVLFISGYGQEAEVSEAEGVGGVDFLEKPFSSSGLVQRVALLLANPGPAVPRSPAQRAGTRPPRHS